SAKQECILSSGGEPQLFIQLPQRVVVAPSIQRKSRQFRPWTDKGRVCLNRLPETVPRDVVSADTYFDVQEADAVPVGSRQGAIFPAGGHVLHSVVGAPVVSVVAAPAAARPAPLVAVSGPIRFCPEHRRGALPQPRRERTKRGQFVR